MMNLTSKTSKLETTSSQKPNSRSGTTLPRRTSIEAMLSKLSFSKLLRRMSGDMRARSTAKRRRKPMKILRRKIIRTGTGIEIKRRKKRKMRTTMRRRRTAMMRSKKMRMITMIRMARIGMRSKKMKMSQQLEPSVG